MKFGNQTSWMLALAIVAMPLAAKAQYTFIDLNPSGFDGSMAFGISGSQQVGFGGGPGGYHALLWSGTAASAADLNPSGFTYASANGISGSQQVGYGNGPSTGGNSHALLWSGTAASAVDLNPSGYDSSAASGISGGQQVGAGWMGGGPSHALLWYGTAASAVDLNPSGFFASYALGISGSQQVGYGVTNGVRRALLWSGTAASAVDLQNFLSSDYTSSQAQGIDANGNIVGSALNSSTGQWDAILWVAIPEPSTFALAGLGAAALFILRRHKRV